MSLSIITLRIIFFTIQSNTDWVWFVKSQIFNRTISENDINKSNKGSFIDNYVVIILVGP